MSSRRHRTLCVKYRFQRRQGFSRCLRAVPHLRQTLTLPRSCRLRAGTHVAMATGTSSSSRDRMLRGNRSLMTAEGGAS